MKLSVENLGPVAVKFMFRDEAGELQETYVGSGETGTVDLPATADLVEMTTVGENVNSTVAEFQRTGSLGGG